MRKQMIGLVAAALLATEAAAAPLSYRHVDPAPDAAAQLTELVALYDRVCLQLFPDDRAVAKEMERRGARPLSQEDVSAYLHEDPGVGWQLAGQTGRFDVTIEAPPFHACGIRVMTVSGFADMKPYRSVADRFEKGRGFTRIEPRTATIGDVETIGGGEARALKDGGGELLLVAQTIPIESVRKKGLDAVQVRLVHQIAAPPAR